jgi:Uma2 family endonuclease
MTTQNNRWTYADIEALPDDGNRYEAVDGELWVTPPPNEPHARFSSSLLASLYAHVKARRLGRVYVEGLGVWLDDEAFVIPDLVFVANDRLPGLSQRGMEGAPTLVVEILSPSTRKRDLGVKRDAYAARGVPHYWVVDPVAKSLESFVLDGGVYRSALRAAAGETVGPPPFPDLRLDLGDVFAD